MKKKIRKKMNITKEEYIESLGLAKKTVIEDIEGYDLSSFVNVSCTSDEVEVQYNKMIKWLKKQHKVI